MDGAGTISELLSVSTFSTMFPVNINLNSHNLYFDM